MRYTLSLMLAILLCLCAADAQTVTITAKHLGGSTPITGTITWQPALPTGQPASTALAGSGGQTSDVAITVPVVAGAFTAVVTDTSASNPSNICYIVTAHQRDGRQVLGPGYTCVQTAQDNSWCSGGVCNFDGYTPNLAPMALVQAGPQGPTGPTGATGATGATGPVGPAGPSIAGVSSDGADGLAVQGAVSAKSVMQTAAESFGGASFSPSPNNPTGGGAFGPSIIVNSDGSCDEWYYNGLGSQMMYTRATDRMCEKWSTPVQVSGTYSSAGAFYTYVWQDGSTYYLVESDAVTSAAAKHLYLYASTDKLHWTVQNGGNPIFTASTVGTDWYYNLYNPAVYEHGSTWYLAVEGGTSTSTDGGVGIMSTTGCPSSCTFTSGPTATFLNTAAQYGSIIGNPDFVAVPDRNAVVLALAPDGGVQAYTASATADLTQRSSWTVAPGFRFFFPAHPQDGPSDPAIAFSPLVGLHPWNGIMAYSNYQSRADQAYTGLTLDAWYDAIANPLAAPINNIAGVCYQLPCVVSSKTYTAQTGVINPGNAGVSLQPGQYLVSATLCTETAGTSGSLSANIRVYNSPGTTMSDHGLTQTQTARGCTSIVFPSRVDAGGSMQWWMPSTLTGGTVWGMQLVVERLQ